MDSDIHGPQMTPPVKNAASPAHSGAGRPSGSRATPQPSTMPVMTGIVLGWGVALLPLGLPAPLWAGLAAFFTGGVIWGPWMSLSMGVFQDASPPGTLA